MCRIARNDQCCEINTIVSFAGKLEARNWLVFNGLTDYPAGGVAEKHCFLHQQRDLALGRALMRCGPLWHYKI